MKSLVGISLAKAAVKQSLAVPGRSKQDLAGVKKSIAGSGIVMMGEASLPVIEILLFMA